MTQNQQIAFDAELARLEAEAARSDLAEYEARESRDAATVASIERSRARMIRAQGRHDALRDVLVVA